MAEGALQPERLKLSEIQVPKKNVREAIVAINDRGLGEFTAAATDLMNDVLPKPNPTALEGWIDRPRGALILAEGTEGNPDHFAVRYFAGSRTPTIHFRKVLHVFGMQVPPDTVLEVPVEPWEGEPAGSVMLNFAKAETRPVTGRSDSRMSAGEREEKR